MTDPKRVVVLGGGPAGDVAALRAAQLGAEVTMIERAELGGTCQLGLHPHQVAPVDGGPA